MTYHYVYKMTDNKQIITSQQIFLQDRVVIRNGRYFWGDYLSPVIGTYCGSNIPSTIRSSGNHLTVIFISDGSSARGTGFKASFDSSGIGMYELFYSYCHTKQGSKLRGTPGCMQEWRYVFSPDTHTVRLGVSNTPRSYTRLLGKQTQFFAIYAGDHLKSQSIHIYFTINFCYLFFIIPNN